MCCAGCTSGDSVNGTTGRSGIIWPLSCENRLVGRSSAWFCTKATISAEVLVLQLRHAGGGGGR